MKESIWICISCITQFLKNRLGNFKLDSNGAMGVSTNGWFPVKFWRVMAIHHGSVSRSHFGGCCYCGDGFPVASASTDCRTAGGSGIGTTSNKHLSLCVWSLLQDWAPDDIIRIGVSMLGFSTNNDVCLAVWLWIWRQRLIGTSCKNCKKPSS